MTKQDLAKQIAAKMGKAPEEAVEFIEAFMKTVMKANADGQTIFLRGFGSFGLKARAAKKARNIGKNETITLPACTIPYFKPSKEFKSRVN